MVGKLETQEGWWCVSGLFEVPRARRTIVAKSRLMVGEGQLPSSATLAETIASPFSAFVLYGVFNGVGEAHSHCEVQSFPSLWIPLLILSENTIRDTPGSDVSPDRYLGPNQLTYKINLPRDGPVIVRCRDLSILYSSR